MKISALKSAMKVVSMITNSSSLVPLYRSVELSPGRMRACSEYGNLEIAMECDLPRPVLIDCAGVNSVIKTVPSEGDLHCELKGDRICWSSKTSTGYWLRVEQSHQIPLISHPHHPWSPPDDFADALMLAGSAVQSATVSVGLYGIVIEKWGQQLHLASTNDWGLALATMAGADFPTRKITIRPPVHKVLSALLRVCPDAALDLTDDGIFFLSDSIRAYFPASPPLEHDVIGFAHRYARGMKVIDIEASAVQQFITRAAGLKGKQDGFHVKVGLERGNLTLALQTESARTDEYLIAEHIHAGVFTPIVIDGTWLRIPLQHVRSVVLDYLSENVLVLRGDEHSRMFQFVISGSQQC